MGGSTRHASRGATPVRWRPGPRPSPSLPFPSPSRPLPPASRGAGEALWRRNLVPALDRRRSRLSGGAAAVPAVGEGWVGLWRAPGPLSQQAFGEGVAGGGSGLLLQASQIATDETRAPFSVKPRWDNVSAEPIFALRCYCRTFPLRKAFHLGACSHSYLRMQKTLVCLTVSCVHSVWGILIEHRNKSTSDGTKRAVRKPACYCSVFAQAFLTQSLLSELQPTGTDRGIVSDGAADTWWDQRRGR